MSAERTETRLIVDSPLLEAQQACSPPGFDGVFASQSAAFFFRLQSDLRELRIEIDSDPANDS